MTNKERSTEKREAKIAEWLVFFTREYLIQRAYGETIGAASRAAIKDVNKAICRDWQAFPSERSFFVDVKLEMHDRMVAEAARIENDLVKEAA